MDEADRLLQDGHFDEFEKILELFGKNRPKSKSIEWKWQTLVFSATFSRDLFRKLDRHQKGKSSSLMGNDEIVQLLNEKLKFKDKNLLLLMPIQRKLFQGKSQRHWLNVALQSVTYTCTTFVNVQGIDSSIC